MAAVVARPPQLGQPASPRNSASSLKLKTAKSVRGPSPHRHLQALSPGLPPAQLPDTPPTSPPGKISVMPNSLLYPPDPRHQICQSPPVYTVDAATLAAALDHAARQPLPESKEVFPWLHGLHAQNHAQLAFFGARRRSARKAPKTLRAITLVKAGGDLNRARLKGAVAPAELLSDGPMSFSTFRDVDPAEGFSVRNFQIQTAKMASISDIVIYGDDSVSPVDLHQLARRFASAQKIRKAQEGPTDRGPPLYHTFVLSTPFSVVEAAHPELVAVDSAGESTGRVLDFFQQERIEMCQMSRAAEIATNVWLGPTPDECPEGPTMTTTDGTPFDLLIEASDLAVLGNPPSWPNEREASDDTPQVMEFPSSGSVVPSDWTDTDTDRLVDMCRWLYEVANAGSSSSSSNMAAANDGNDNDEVDGQSRARKVLIHCGDGYTETSFLGLAYLMFVEGIPAHEAWLRLHRDRGRNFFAYPSDVSVLLRAQRHLLEASPMHDALGMCRGAPNWLLRMDGSLPSRILPYLYLGNLGHANNPGLLQAMGIGQVLSVGELVAWTEAERKEWNGETLMVDGVQDNGIDPLMGEFGRCLAFIEQGKARGTATLVHCRVGVSRSATICIAEVMKHLGLSLPRACFVRARRLNVIIQPHLRFSYELLQWEERRCEAEHRPVKRELEWATIAREIALMNKPYSR
ncbi:MAG: hypothetical protein M1823_002044 [Watsoniomyces obsoletus]|nr:MAG: hypothetical protein M1823_002044 [Watsoniomyces obsoletus]